MHTALMLLSFLLLVPGCLFAFWLLRHFSGWTWHRYLHLLVLAVPLVSLGVNLGTVDHFVGQTCFATAPRWDVLLSLVLALSMGTIALGGVVLGAFRHLFLAVFVTRKGWAASTELQGLIAQFATTLGIVPPRVLLCTSPSPLALTYGVKHPTLVLSPWMLKQLEPRELEAVLAHEMAHIARRDTLISAMAQIMRDAFCYIPTSWLTGIGFLALSAGMLPRSAFLSFATFLFLLCFLLVQRGGLGLFLRRSDGLGPRVRPQDSHRERFGLVLQSQQDQSSPHHTAQAASRTLPRRSLAPSMSDMSLR